MKSKRGGYFRTWSAAKAKALPASELSIDANARYRRIHTVYTPIDVNEFDHETFRLFSHSCAGKEAGGKAKTRARKLTDISKNQQRTKNAHIAGGIKTTQASNEVRAAYLWRLRSSWLTNTVTSPGQKELRQQQFARKAKFCFQIIDHLILRAFRFRSKSLHISRGQCLCAFGKGKLMLATTTLSKKRDKACRMRA